MSHPRRIILLASLLVGAPLSLRSDDVQRAFLQSRNRPVSWNAASTPTPSHSVTLPSWPPPTPTPTPFQDNTDPGDSSPSSAKPKPAERKPHNAPSNEEPPAPVVIEKSDGEEEEPTPTPTPKRAGLAGWLFGEEGPRYKYISASVLRAIKRPHVSRHRWRNIVIHHSETRQGNAKAFDYYHRRVRRMPNGLAYHFVIGNGTSSGDGAIEIGSRWAGQRDGGHVHSDYLNSISIGICLVGDFHRSRPTRRQLEATTELIACLRGIVGKTDRKPAAVRPHREVNPARWPTDCPGKRFPYSFFNKF